MILRSICHAIWRATVTFWVIILLIFGALLGVILIVGELFHIPGTRKAVRFCQSRMQHTPKARI
jgi:hypothetical protein